MAKPPTPPAQSRAAARSDPVGDHYYRPLVIAETWSNWLFWIAAVLSILALTVERSSSPKLYDLVQGAFVIGVVALFVLGLAVRLYWTPRAEDKRRQSLLSNALNVAITHEQVVGYYNNKETMPLKRLGAALLENSLFSKSILLTMARGERLRVVAYVLVWIVAALYRATDLALVAALAQAIFGEQIVSRWLRLEWVRNRFEHVYDHLYQLFQSTQDFDRDEFRIRVLAEFGEYETTKAYGGILLSTLVFNRLNPALSLEWEQIKQRLML